jgi:hypothetical protein
MGAFVPLRATSPAASSGGLVRTEGYPGTMRVPAGPPAAIPNVGFDPRTNPSACAPDYICPSIYVTHLENMHPPSAIHSDNVLPVPVPRVGRVARMAPHQQRIGGQRVTRNPRPIITWPTYGGGS